MIKKELSGYDKMVSWSFTKTVLILGFIWGFSEGIVFFIVPDIIITFVALFSFRKSFKVMIAVLTGSIISGILMYYFGLINFEMVKALVVRVPFVSESMFISTHQDFEALGIWALLKGPMSGIPYKVYSIQSSAYASILSFVIVSIPARLERLMLTWFMFAFGGYLFRRKIKENQVMAIRIHSVYWIIIYVLYWIRI